MIRADQRDALLRGADPEHRRDRTSDAAQLRAVRGLVDQRRAATGRPAPAAGRRPVRRRRAALVVAAVAAVTAAPVVLSLTLPGESEPERLVPAAVAADGQLQCSSNGATRKLRPAEADPRYLPGWLPSGWALTGIRANETTWVRWCVQPSLVALQLSDRGLVTGKLLVTGPIQATVDGPLDLGAPAADVIDGHPARRFTAEAGVPLQSWLWTDGAGRQWMAEASGFPDAGGLLAAVSTAGEQVRWDGARAPGLRLVHLRTAKPYSTTSRIMDWTVSLDDGTREREILVTRRYGDAIPVASRAELGARLVTVDGHPAVIQPTIGNHGAEPDAGDDNQEAQTPVAVEIAPGIVAQSAAFGDLSTVERLLASLAPAPVDDARL